MTNDLWTIIAFKAVLANKIDEAAASFVANSMEVKNMLKKIANTIMASADVVALYPRVTNHAAL